MLAVISQSFLRIKSFRIRSSKKIIPQPRFEKYLNCDMEVLLQRKVSMKERNVQILRNPENGKISARFVSLIDGSNTPARTVGSVFETLNMNRDRDKQVELINRSFPISLFDDVELLVKLASCKNCHS